MSGNDASGEPDDMNDEDLSNAQSKGGPAAPVPPRKPEVPEKGNDANSMKHLIDGAVGKLKAWGESVPASSLSTDHPYGDGTHGTAGGDPLDRLGAGKKYGE